MIAEIVVLAVEQPDRGPLEMILPPPAELFWGAVAFAIVYAVIAKLAFPKINDLLEERAASIQGRMADAERQLEEAGQTKAEYEQKLQEAGGEAERILDEARERAETVRREILARAEAEAEQIIERARAEVAVERERTVGQLRGEVSRLSVTLAEKIIQRELDAAAHAELVDRYIDSLVQGNGGVRQESP
jgi:F-type H+-transporting ATPase subunit b